MFDPEFPTKGEMGKTTIFFLSIFIFSGTNLVADVKNTLIL